MKPVRYQVGDKVVITEDCIKRIRDSNRSCVTPQYPTDSFIKDAQALVGVEGEVTHTFPPGYEVTAQFGDKAFHMKDHWIAPAGTPIEAQEQENPLRPSNRRDYPSM